MRTRSKKKWKIMAKRKREREELEQDAKRLAEFLRGVKPVKRGGFHSPEKKAEKNVHNRRHKRESLKQKMREYNSTHNIEE